MHGSQLAVAQLSEKTDLIGRCGSRRVGLLAGPDVVADNTAWTPIASYSLRQGKIIAAAGRNDPSSRQFDLEALWQNRSAGASELKKSLAISQT
jgi:hypothetical protein